MKKPQRLDVGQSPEYESYVAALRSVTVRYGANVTSYVNGYYDICRRQLGGPPVPTPEWLSIARKQIEQQLLGE